MNFIKDIALDIKKIKNDKSSLRKFGITIASALSVLGVLVFFLGSKSENAYWLWGIAASFLILGFTAPTVLKPINTVWMTLAVVLGWFVSRMVLSIIFYLVMVPIGLIMKIMRKDLLNQRIENNIDSYWIKRDSVNVDLNKYEKLF